MRALRSWIAIPAIAVVAAVLAVGSERSFLEVGAAAVLAAALAAAIRAFVGAGVLGAIAAGAGSVLGVLGWLEPAAQPHAARAALAGAAAMFAVCELVRPRAPTSSPWPAVGASVLAGVLDPAYAPLVAISSAAVLAAPIPRPRWIIVLPLAGVLVALLALLAAWSRTGALARLELAWSGHLGHAPADVLSIAAAIGDRLGPLAGVAAIAGLAQCAGRGRVAAAATLGIAAFAVLDTISGASVAPSLAIVAALGAGVAVGRLAALVRLPIGQAFVAATAGFLLVAVPLLVAVR
jgi:hypothetical protein